MLIEEIFDWELTLRFKDTNKINKDKWEVLIWYDFPRLFVSRKGQLLLYLEETNGKDLWLLIKPKQLNILFDYLKSNISLKDLIESDKVSLSIVNWYHDPDKDLEKRNEISLEKYKKRFKLPGNKSFLGTLYINVDELIQCIESFSKQEDMEETVEIKVKPISEPICTTLVREEIEWGEESSIFSCSDNSNLEVAA